MCVARHGPDFQVAEFLLGLGAVSEWDIWREGGKASSVLPDNMLRPLVVDDFSNQLAGDLAPLNVQEWRRYTDARDFYYPQAHKVCPVNLPSLTSVQGMHL